MTMRTQYRQTSSFFNGGNSQALSGWEELPGSPRALKGKFGVPVSQYVRGLESSVFRVKSSKTLRFCLLSRPSQSGTAGFDSSDVRESLSLRIVRLSSNPPDKPTTQEKDFFSSLFLSGRAVVQECHTMPD